MLIERELVARGIDGIVPAHGTVFAFLFRQQGPVPVMSLVEWSGRAKSTMTGIVQTLEKHGYVYRQPSAEDARSVLIGLTEKGWAIKRDFEGISDLLIKKAYGAIPASDRKRLVTLLAQIEKNMG